MSMVVLIYHFKRAIVDDSMLSKIINAKLFSKFELWFQISNTLLFKSKKMMAEMGKK